MHRPAVRPAPRAGTALAALACAGLLCALGGAPALAKPAPTTRPVVTPSTPVTPGSDYLALGDSVTFGYMEPTVVPAPDYRNAASFDAYPEMLGSELGLKVTNAACPGETSTSLVNAAAPSNGCENAPGSAVAYRKTYPLHVSYAGSQLAYAVSYLKRHPTTRLVSLMIGANDLFLCQAETSDGCLSPTEQQPVLASITKHVRTILGAIRTRAGYHGQLVIVDYYSLDYASALINSESVSLNQAQAAGAKGFHVRFANAYQTFAAASTHSGEDTCTAGLLTQLGTPSSCGVHPSDAGQTLLAATVANAIRIG
jgi:lysophospholipase L1-like esterase